MTKIGFIFWGKFFRKWDKSGLCFSGGGSVKDCCIDDTIFWIVSGRSLEPVCSVLARKIAFLEGELFGSNFAEE